MLSAIIVTKDEEHNIRDCLDSLRWVDEIVVVDSGSTDNTINICKEYTEIVIESSWSGFGKQKNKALSLAKGDWVLSLDADERVSVNLKSEIMGILKLEDSEAAYKIPRESQFCGRVMKYSGWYPDYVLRLFKNGCANFSDDLVHEKVITKYNVGTLNNPIAHYPVNNLEQSIGKMNFYSTLSAQAKYDKGERASIYKACFRGFWTFLNVYFFRLGILDGSQGLMLSIANAEGTYYKYLKLAQMNLDIQRGEE